jgi:hypothetical protein
MQISGRGRDFALLQIVPNSSGAHPTFRSTGNILFSRVEKWSILKVEYHVLLVPRLRKVTAAAPLP